MDVTVKVDGVGINATHYTKMKKDEAVKAMEADQVLKTHGKDATWAGKVYDLAVKAVADDKKKQEDAEKLRKQKAGKQGLSTEDILDKAPPGANLAAGSEVKPGS